MTFDWFLRQQILLLPRVHLHRLHMAPTDPKQEDQQGATHRHHPAALSPEILRDALVNSTAASNKASAAISDALAALPKLMADALVAAQAAQANHPAQAAAPVLGAGAAPAASPTFKELRDRKVPDFWEDDPEAWFKIMDAHLGQANPPLSEQVKFTLLLPLLQGPAVKKIVRLVKAPPPTVYTKAKEILIRHYKRDDNDMIAELLGLTSLGDHTAVDFLEHMRSLQAGDPEGKIFRFIFIRCLPRHIATVVSGKDDLDEMAAAADVILSTVPDSASSTGFNADTLSAAAISWPRGQLLDGLCSIHHKFGKEAYNCAAPDSCKMKSILKKKPRRGQGQGHGQGDRSSAQGNSKAGSQ